MTTHDRAVAFAKEVEKENRIRELAKKNDSPEGLTDAELDEFVRLIERVAYRFGRT